MNKNDGYSSLLIADYILSKHDYIFTSFKLIKMIYIAHGRTLAAFDKPLIHDRIEAWRYGPVIPVLYHELKMWGDKKIQNLHYCGTDINNAKLCKERLNFFKTIISSQECSIVDNVINEFGNRSFEDLQLLCHARGSPWDACYDGKMYAEIPDERIKKYYKEQILVVD